MADQVTVINSLVERVNAQSKLIFELSEHVSCLQTQVVGLRKAIDVLGGAYAECDAGLGAMQEVLEDVSQAAAECEGKKSGHDTTALQN